MSDGARVFIVSDCIFLYPCYIHTTWSLPSLGFGYIMTFQLLAKPATTGGVILVSFQTLTSGKLLRNTAIKLYETLIIYIWIWRQAQGGLFQGICLVSLTHGATIIKYVNVTANPAVFALWESKVAKNNPGILTTHGRLSIAGINCQEGRLIKPTKPCSLQALSTWKCGCGGHLGVFVSTHSKPCPDPSGFVGSS